MSTPDIAALAGLLDEATRTATAIPQLSGHQPLTLEEAYAVQRAVVSLRSDRGDPIVGIKLGFTSKAKAAQMGVSDVIVGSVTASMQVEDGGTCEVSRLVHPRIEPEVAFRLGSAVDPYDPDSDIVAAVTEVAAALEIIDSRYKDFSFSLEDVVADNTSAAGFVIGPWHRFAEIREALDLANLDVQLEVDGQVAESGSTGDILGDPVLALAAVKRMAARHGLELPAGSVILAGAATAAVPFPAGATVVATVAGLGRAAVNAGGAA